MKEVRFSTKAKKDVKRYRHRLGLMEELYHTLDLLRKGEPLPPNYNAHKLTGQYADCLECHMGGDYLLIWIDEESDSIYVVRVGTHSELFGH